MSFLAARLAAKESSFFLHESKLAAGRLSKTLPATTSGELPANSSTTVTEEQSNILPEILRHSIPINSGNTVISDPSLSTSSKWLINGHDSSSASSISSDAFNPLRAYVSIPRVTFGPKRWELPNEQPAFCASTANELRRDRYPPMNPEKLKEFANGYSQIGKAFAAATMIVFGGATALFVYAVHKLQIESTEDIRSKGRDLMQPRAEKIRAQIAPLRYWAENNSKKWRLEGDGKVKEKPIVVKQLTKMRFVG